MSKYTLAPIYTNRGASIDPSLDQLEYGLAQLREAVEGLIQKRCGTMNKPKARKPQPVQDQKRTVGGPLSAAKILSTPSSSGSPGLAVVQHEPFSGGTGTGEKTDSSQAKSYEPTVVMEGSYLVAYQSICVMPRFINQSHEELRLSWYKAHEKPKDALREWEKPSSRPQRDDTSTDLAEADQTLVDGDSSDISTLISKLMTGSSPATPALTSAHQVDSAPISAIDAAELEWARASRELKAKRAALALAQAEHEEASRDEGFKLAKYLVERSRAQ